MKGIRFSYDRVEAGQTLVSELAYLPITLSTVNGSIELQGLLDSGSTVNILCNLRLCIAVTDGERLEQDEKRGM